MVVIPLRLEPGSDLKQELQALVRREGLTAAWVMSCVGSLEQITLRLADIHTAAGQYEIISAAGTLSANGVHVHLAIADPAGTLTGGHLMSGCVVAAEGSVEIVIGADDGWRFERGRHRQTGYDELTITRA
jgi:predicted DNA-binding protein with PD1-like motif